MNVSARVYAAAAAVVVVVAILAAVFLGGDEPTLRPPRPELVAAADLDPCPPSRPDPVPGGLPDLTFPCLGEGPEVHLAGLTGTPTVVNIWASWCLPCRKEAPYFTRLHEQLGGEVRFLGVDDEDDPNSALDFASNVRPRMRYPSVRDESRELVIALAESGPIVVPSTLFVDASGRVVHRKVEVYRDLAALRADIATYLGVGG